MEELRGTLRESKAKIKELEELSRTTSLKSALQLMVCLQGHPFMEKEVIKEYDKKTGEPKKYVWETCKTFGTDFTFGGESYGGDIKVHLTNKVINEIKRGPVCFDMAGKRYVAKFETKNHGGSDRDGPISCIEHLVYLSEVRNL